MTLTGKFVKINSRKTVDNASEKLVQIVARLQGAYASEIAMLCVGQLQVYEVTGLLHLTLLHHSFT